MSERQSADTERPFVTDVQAELALALIYEPVVNAMSGLEFRCLINRMVDRLAKNGWTLTRAHSDGFVSHSEGGTDEQTDGGDDRG